jgi:hypothetical protein
LARQFAQVPSLGFNKVYAGRDVLLFGPYQADSARASTGSAHTEERGSGAHVAPLARPLVERFERDFGAKGRAPCCHGHALPLIPVEIIIRDVLQRGSGGAAGRAVSGVSDRAPSFFARRYYFGFVSSAVGWKRAVTIVFPSVVGSIVYSTEISVARPFCPATWMPI